MALEMPFLLGMDKETKFIAPLIAEYSIPEQGTLPEHMESSEAHPIALFIVALEQKE